MGADAETGHQEARHGSGATSHPPETDTATQDSAPDTTSRPAEQPVDDPDEDQESAGDASDKTSEDDADDTDEIGDNVPEPSADDDEPLEEDAPDSTPHSMAEHNRGRFVTSPDRTPWYTTHLDWDAITDALEPTIAGELESPAIVDGDESAAGTGGETVHAETNGGSTLEPDGSNKEQTTDTDQSDAEESTMYAAPPAHSTDSPEPVDPEVDDTRAEVDGDSVPSDTRSESPETDMTDDDSDGGVDEIPGNPADHETPTGTADNVEANPTAEADPTVELSYAEGETDAEDDVGLEVSDGAATDLEGRNEHDESMEGIDDVEDDSGAEESTHHQADELDAFDVEEPIDLDPSISVDDALEELNDETPTLSLSSHQFDVTAEQDDDDATLIFSFDSAVVSITGSTKRLLTYQLQSFANQESTPDGSVSIEGQQITIDIPDADGNAIQRWGRGAVSIIDRTLYLSDTNS